MFKTTLLILCCLALLGQSAGLPFVQPSEPIRSPRLGVTFISSAQHPADEGRYRAGLGTGAGWNRWPLYWPDVEPVPGEWDWRAYDQLVAGDIGHGLQINAILLGIPKARAGGAPGAPTAIPLNLWEPVFADGTDTPAPGKRMNPRNYWADFVFRAVWRYKPGGFIPSLLQLESGAGVRVWEVWNEPDSALFWSASVEDYVRLLKVAYLAIKQADSEAQVMFGGLANEQHRNWLTDALEVIAQDPMRDVHGWYFDIMAVHNYSLALRTWQAVHDVRATLNVYGLSKPIWVNESGVPAWDDYPGPTWASPDSPPPFQATMQEQAAFVVQSAAYAFVAGAEVFFYHQLYDDCGNQPEATDFPPHDGALCEEGVLCWGDAHGLYRNPVDGPCFRQHPEPGSPRPALRAFQTLAAVFGAHPFEPVSLENRGADGLETWITFRRPDTQERILVLWNRAGDPVDVEIAATAHSATRYDMAGHVEEITPSAEGVYRLTLPAATNQTHPFAPPTDPYAIGGAPYILVEHDPAGSSTARGAGGEG